MLLFKPRNKLYKCGLEFQSLLFVCFNTRRLKILCKIMIYSRTWIYRTPKGSRNSSIYEKFDIKNMRSETSAVAHGHLLIGAFKNDN